MAPLSSRLATPGSIIELVHSGDRESQSIRQPPPSPPCSPPSSSESIRQPPPTPPCSPPSSSESIRQPPPSPPCSPRDSPESTRPPTPTTPPRQSDARMPRAIWWRAWRPPPCSSGRTSPKRSCSLLRSHRRCRALCRPRASWGPSFGVSYSNFSVTPPSCPSAAAARPSPPSTRPCSM